MLMPYLEWLSWESLTFFTKVIAVYFFVHNGFNLFLVTVSFFYVRRQYKTLNIHDFAGVYQSELYPSYSIIVPVFNEPDIEETVRSLLTQQYGEFEIILVNDGSTDDTLDRLKEAFDLRTSDKYVSDVLDHKPIRNLFYSDSYDNLVVVDKENGKPADAMNAGLNVAEKDLFCAVDGDSILEQNVLIKMLRSFAKDEETVAVGGIVRVANGCTIKDGEVKSISTPNNIIQLIQIVEYVRSFLFGRVGWDYFNSLILISGAFGVFDRQAVINAGGYSPDAIGQDFDLTLKLHKYHIDNDLSYKINFQPEPVCWTNVPSTWHVLSGQRNRWQRGLIQTLWRFKEMMFNAKYGSVGLVVLPIYLLFELIGPIIEMGGYILFSILLFTGSLPPKIALLFFTVAVVFSVLLSVISLLCDQLTYGKYTSLGDIGKLSFASLLETFGYRQLHVWWRIKAFYTFITGDMKWDRSFLSTRMLEIINWIFFLIINGMIFYLIYYGLSNI